MPWFKGKWSVDGDRVEKPVLSTDFVVGVLAIVATLAILVTVISYCGTR